MTTPLTFSFASEIYEHVYRQFCRLMRVPEAVVAERDDAFRNLLGLVRGRLYYNILNWYRILALLPGFTLNRSFMEQMMGVKAAARDRCRRDRAVEQARPDRRLAAGGAHGCRVDCQPFDTRAPRSRVLPALERRAAFSRSLVRGAPGPTSWLPTIVSYASACCRGTRRS